MEYNFYRIKERREKGRYLVKTYDKRPNNTHNKPIES